jgi:hypothetical protein
MFEVARLQQAGECIAEEIQVHNFEKVDSIASAAKAVLEIKAFNAAL